MVTTEVIMQSYITCCIISMHFKIGVISMQSGKTIMQAATLDCGLLGAISLQSQYATAIQ